MKLVALLKDSYREARDRKIFAAMLVLSGLLTLFILSISFKPIALQEELNSFARQMNFWMHFDPHSATTNIAIENFRQTNDAKEAWHGDYAFDWVVKAKDADALKHFPFAKQREVRQITREAFNYLDNIEVAKNSARDPAEARFAIASQGTKVSDALSWRYEPSVLFAVPLPFMTTSLREGVYLIEDTLVGGLGAWVAVLVGIIVTASFIPDMLQKGSIDLLLAKPVRRVGLLLYKYVGGLLFVFLLTAATVCGVWAAIGLRTGVWAPHFLLVIPAVTFFFAVLYSVSTLTAVLTRSTVVCILVTCVAWFGLWLNGWVHGKFDAMRKTRSELETTVREVAGSKSKTAPKGDAKAADTTDGEDAPEDRGGGMAVPQWVYATSDFLYGVLPRTGELDRLTAGWVARGVLSESEIKRRKLDREPPRWGEVFGVSGAFIAVMLGLASWRFARADY